MGMVPFLALILSRVASTHVPGCVSATSMVVRA